MSAKDRYREDLVKVWNTINKANGNWESEINGVITLLCDLSIVTHSIAICKNDKMDKDVMKKMWEIIRARFFSDYDLEVHRIKDEAKLSSILNWSPSPTSPTYNENDNKLIDT